MIETKIKDSIRIIEANISNIERYMQNGGSNHYTIQSELNSIKREIQFLTIKINDLIKIN